MEEVEISQIDTSFERIRIRDRAAQKALLDSIIEGGIREPLKCVIPPQGRMLLLDGFKRLRCAVKLGIKAVPVLSLGSDEATAILHLLRTSTAKTLSTLEQAGLFFELIKARNRKHTTIFTTQLGFEERGNFLNNIHLTAALLDRITVNCTVFNMKECISIRPKNIIYATKDK